MDLRQTKEYGNYLKGRGWIVERVGEISVFIKRLRLIPISVMKIQRFKGEISKAQLLEVKKRNRVFMSVIEPIEEEVDYKEWGYRKSKDSYLPTKTVVIDLKKTKEELWKEVKKDAKGLIKSNEKLEIKEIKSEEELGEFYKQWKKWGKGYVPGIDVLNNLVKAFGNKALVVVGVIDGEFICGLVELMSDDGAYYYYAWTSDKGRERGSQYKLVWEEILKAKKRGLKWWDFEGIEDSRNPRKSWEGFSLFKKKFGGEEKEFPGSWQRWI